MVVLIKLIIDICLLRAKPGDLPYSKFLLILCLITYMILGVAITLSNQSVTKSILIVIVDTSLLLIFAYGALWFRNQLNRATQMVTALAGSGVLFTALSIPIVFWLQQIDPSEPSPISLLLLLIFAWNVAVIGYILQHALNVKYWVGFGISATYVYVSLRLMNTLFMTSELLPMKDSL
jgi:drug/metabolite transporter (DMT)-like permease